MINRGMTGPPGAVMVACSIITMIGCASPGRSDDEERTAVAAARSTAAPTCITIRRGSGGVVADTQIGDGDPARLDHNWGDSTVMNSGIVPDAGSRRALLRFDLGSIPVGSLITQATVTLVADNHGAATVRVHRITGAWGETTVTWNNFGDAFDPAVVATFANGGPSYTGPVQIDVAALAQAWALDPAQNHGILLEQDPVGNTRYQTSESALATRPKLDVCYQPPSCTDGLQNQGELGVDCGGPCRNECPHPGATEVVNAGTKAQSPHYKATFTLGQPTQDQNTATSPHYRKQGGLIGANGSLP